MKSDIVGVYFVHETKRSSRWEYRFRYEDFQSRQSFSISKYGPELARELAENEIIKLCQRFDLPVRKRNV